MGLVEEGETPADAAAREVLEETGWRPGPIKPLIYAEPANGITDSQHHVFRAEGATYEGPPTEKNESDWIEWIPLADVRAMIDRREIVSSRLPRRAALRAHGRGDPLTWRGTAAIGVALGSHAHAALKGETRYAEPPPDRINRVRIHVGPLRALRNKVTDWRPWPD
jgi:hypothetical protein